MWELIVSGAILAGEYTYNWYVHRHDRPPPTPNQTIKVPTSQPGATIPMIYGACLVKTPVLAWAGHAAFVTGASQLVTAQFIYGMDMHFLAAVFPENGSCGFLGLHIGETALGIATGDGSTGAPFSCDNSVSGPDPANQFIGGLIETLHGGPAQDFVADGTHLAGRMLGDVTPPFPELIPGHHGVLSVFCFGNGSAPWFVGASPQPGSYAIECYGWPSGLGSGMVGAINTIIGLIPADCCPVDVIYDLMTGQPSLGKLGISPFLIDAPSFTAAAKTLLAEGHGFSRSFEDSGQNVVDRINEVCRQIDGVLYENLTTGLFVLKLIRADYDPPTLPVINPDNCEEIQNFSAPSWTGLPNDIYVTYTDRSNNYIQMQARAQNQAHANAQSGEVVQMTIALPGVTNETLAKQIALRELSARSRPLMKCRAIVNRSFLRVHPGDCVKLLWPEANISNVIMRVANVGVGMLENGSIKLDLVQDYFYVHRDLPPQSILDAGGGVHSIGDEIP